MDKYDNGDSIDKDSLMMLALNKYINVCTKDKWLSKSHEEQHIVALSTEMEKIKYTNLKLEKVFKSIGTLKGKTNNQVNQKGNNKKSPK